ncbi:hypothetical protein [Tardiphaga sp. 619_E2_N8_5]|jgi:hypothetical protein|uniref:hypothetical protein n=1 Tax=unclassified Tardiphaga TaxID=2631404 RepID=UPI003F2505E1
MDLRENVYLRHQLQRFMRPDAARYLNPHAARFLKRGSEKADVYPALARKYEGQPRIPEGEEGGGQFTFGTSGSERPRVYITRREGVGDAGLGDGEGDSGSGFGNDLDSFLLAAAGPPGIGHNQGPPLGDPPRIPETKPSRSPSTFLRSAASWIGRALGLGLAVDAYFSALNEVEWIKEKAAEIETYRDPARTMQELQDAVDEPRPGTEIHHIAERTAAERWGFPRSEIESRENLVRIPTLKHYDITGWYGRQNDKFGGLSPREYLADKGLEERMRVGREALILYEVLKP